MWLKAIVTIPHTTKRKFLIFLNSHYQLACHHRTKTVCENVQKTSFIKKKKKRHCMRICTTGYKVHCAHYTTSMRAKMLFSHLFCLLPNVQKCRWASTSYSMDLNIIILFCKCYYRWNIKLSDSKDIDIEV